MVIYSIFYLIIFGIIIGGLYLIVKGSIKKSFPLIFLGLNVSVLPLAYFIGIMATDAPNSDYVDFLKGFLFIQGIPILLLIISLLKLLFSSLFQKNSNVN